MADDFSYKFVRCKEDTPLGEFDEDAFCDAVLFVYDAGWYTPRSDTLRIIGSAYVIMRCWLGAPTPDRYNIYEKHNKMYLKKLYENATKPSRFIPCSPEWVDRHKSGLINLEANEERAIQRLYTIANERKTSVQFIVFKMLLDHARNAYIEASLHNMEMTTETYLEQVHLISTGELETDEINTEPALYSYFPDSVSSIVFGADLLGYVGLGGLFPLTTSSIENASSSP